MSAIELYDKDGKATGVYFCSSRRIAYETKQEADWCHGERVELRMVRCAVMYHVPCEGQKRIVRTDTGEQVREEAMTEAEKQLNLFAAQAEFDEFMRRQAIGDAKTPQGE